MNGSFLLTADTRRLAATTSTRRLPPTTTWRRCCGDSAHGANAGRRPAPLPSRRWSAACQALREVPPSAWPW